MFSGKGARTAPVPHISQRDGGERRQWRRTASRTVESDLQRRLRRELQALGVRPPLDVEALCLALAEKRRRPIVLKPARLEKPGPSGLWVDTPGMDVILYQQETTRFHQDLIILHEVGHIIVADDEAAGVDGALEDPDDYVEGWATLIPVLDRKLIQRVSRRCSYDSEEECSVELAATIIMEWASKLRDVPLSEDPAVSRIEKALGDRTGWL
ncbi:hypothetical protein OG259_04215 [Streptomyces sp. NBC_00250]|uniref:hypothetical protein n=1 Tax=Streptomyces sp. NBC_00250 TaxID=2903641 RepID=UPI002E2D37C6|nr:hypothetical protein [Streptomyces sp. NBC_00250]